ncbi:ABC transporter permease [Telmatocola sphagniphila]|uniref:ABC transporter permease n=1 Tax=Telmatocola sphagniphila TaxID=1123043 RepID=A0A8E6BAE7_9BACT|nr:ABC transporter permease [Telmatocola sphagniphila]QVL34364.1 ABC transporter permease [Telmatocola sphagniphila]
MSALEEQIDVKTPPLPKGLEPLQDDEESSFLTRIQDNFVKLASFLASFIPMPAILHFCRAVSPRTELEIEMDPLLGRPRIVSFLLGVISLFLLVSASAFLAFISWGLLNYFGRNPFNAIAELSADDLKAAITGIVQGTIPFIYALEFLSISQLEHFPDHFRQIAWFIQKRTAILGNLLLFGLSLIPLSVFIMALPMVFPNEAVLSDTIPTYRSRIVGLFRRLMGALTALAVLVILVAVSIELVSLLKLQKSYVSPIPAKIFPQAFLDLLPTVLVEQWHYVLICVYLLDIGLLLIIGKVPLRYNIRNISVRWLTTAMTGLAFTLVVGLLILMFSFVNGLNKVSSESGIPGNVFVLSEGSIDETFSNLGYSDINQMENERAEEDRSGRPLAKSIGIKQVNVPGSSKKVKLISKETYISVNHEVAARPGFPMRHRLLPVRAIQDAWVAAKVHNMELIDGEWFDDKPQLSADGKTTLTPCVMGEAAARKFGEDVGKPIMKIGDTVKLGELNMVVVGIMKSEGTTFGSEVWTRWERATQAYNKKTFTTVVLRVEDDKPESAEIMAYHLSTNFKNPRVRAVTETQYFEDLAKGSAAIFTVILVIAAIMAIGGIFGVMNTMFATVAQRVKDIGVLRILGFKRWQLLISFMLETLSIALLGGLVGCLIGYFADGFKMDSTLSSGNGSNKSVTIRLTVDMTIIVCAILFTLIMGRLGGLVPSLSAMRMKILDSLR